MLDLRPDAIIADYFVICTAKSERQISALADNVREVVKKEFQSLPYSTEGEDKSGWVLMDYGNLVVHIFSEELRLYYDLESLWREAHVVVSIQ